MSSDGPNSLPRILFSCLNPDRGETGINVFFDIAAKKNVAIESLEVTSRLLP